MAHPMPDLAVQASFESGGAATIVVEIDPRSFAADPLTEPYLQHWVWQEMAAAERDRLIAQAKDFVRSSVELRFEPMGRLDPDFAFEFTKAGGEPLSEIEDPVMLTGRWRTSLPRGFEGYQVEALPAGKLSVLFLTRIDGSPVKRNQVLFPGETSYLLDLTAPVANPAEAPGAGRKAESVNSHTEVASTRFVVHASLILIAGVAIWWAIASMRRKHSKA